MATTTVCWLMALCSAGSAGLSAAAAAAPPGPPRPLGPHPNCTVCAHCTNCPPHCDACDACSHCAHGDCPQHCVRLRPYPPLLPTGPGSFAMNRSTLAFGENATGLYDPQLAARFGAFCFDCDSSRSLWLGSIPNGSVHHLIKPDNPEEPSWEELVVENCRLIKQVNPHTRCLVYRNGMQGLQWLSSEAAAMYGPDNET